MNAGELILDEHLINEFVENITKVIKINPKDEYLVVKNDSPLDFMFISGGATRFIGLGSAAITVLEMGYNPQVYGGISAGSILLLPLIMGLHEEIIEIGRQIKPSIIFESAPINDEGKITFKAVIRIIFQKYSLGLQNIKPIVSQVITEDIFKQYQEGDYPDAYVLAVNGNTLRRKLWNLKDSTIDYEKFLKILSASSRIPIMTQAEWIDGQPYFDGGLRNHTPSTKILQRYDKIRKVISIYAREKNINRPSQKWQKNIIQMIFRTIECMSLEISKRDEEMEKMMSIIKGFHLKQFHLDNILDSMYDTTPENLESLRLNGIEQVKKNIGNFLSS